MPAMPLSETPPNVDALVQPGPYTTRASPFGNSVSWKSNRGAVVGAPKVVMLRQVTVHWAGPLLM